MFATFESKPVDCARVSAGLPSLSLCRSSTPPPIARRYYNEEGDLIELGDVIGQGTYGEVRAATLDILDIVVKIADMKSENRARSALNEVEKLKFLGINLHTPMFYNKTEMHNRIYMEIGRLGSSLADLHKQRKEKPFELKSVLDIAISLMDAVAFIHSKEIIHFDLKCKNICTWINDPSRVKVIDFGSSLFKRDVPSHSKFIQTTAYMSPEALLSLPQCYPTDIWASGVVLFRLFSGCLPFPTSQFIELFRLYKVYGMLPENASKSRYYAGFMHKMVQVEDYDEFLGDEALVARSRELPVKTHETVFISSVMHMLEPEVEKRLTASACSVLFRDLLIKFSQ